MAKTSAEYTVRESTVNFGMFFYCHNCGNRMFSVSKDKMKYNNCECPKCKKILKYKEDKYDNRKEIKV